MAWIVRVLHAYMMSTWFAMVDLYRAVVYGGSLRCSISSFYKLRPIQADSSDTIKFGLRTCAPWVSIVEYEIWKCCASRLCKKPLRDVFKKSGLGTLYRLLADYNNKDGYMQQQQRISKATATSEYAVLKITATQSTAHMNPMTHTFSYSN